MPRKETLHIIRDGQQAPDDAVRQGRVEVVLADPATDERTSFGTLIRRRRCGAYHLRLARDAAAHMWWIVAVDGECGHTATIGFVEARRRECEALFNSVTEAELRMT